MIEPKTLLKKIGDRAQLDFSSFKDVSPGYSGSAVYVAQTKERQKFIIKLSPRKEEPSFADEPVENRVYGGRFSNLKPSLTLLLRHGIKAPKLLATGAIHKFNYAVLEFLPGRPIGNSRAQYQMMGEQLGILHRITRKYQGWVQAQSSYGASWETLFFTALNIQLYHAAKVSRIVRKNKQKIESFIADKRKVWTNPKSFVFSHTDGFQGMAKKENNKWIFQGMIDVEDYQFTDQCLVLCGIELMARMFLHKKVPKSFWSAYQKKATLDGRYKQLKDLFTLFYLLSWLPGYHRKSERTFLKAGEEMIKISVSAITSRTRPFGR